MSSRLPVSNDSVIRLGNTMTKNTAAADENLATQVYDAESTMVRAPEAGAQTVILDQGEDLPPTQLLCGNDPGDEDAIPDLAIGSVLKDRFVIESVLGRGGMGVVYRALDRRAQETDDQDPYIALKVLSADFRSDPRMVVALQRESRKSQTLAHPAIATVYDFDRDGELVYLTMEVLQGMPLDEVLKKHPEGMGADKAVSIIRGLCLGLAYAHNKNIIHSDFKPGNVFLSEDGTTKILDFGIARAAPANTFGNVSSQQHGCDSAASQPTVSQDTDFDAGELGALTPAYASCEMFEGKVPHPADDVYALAVVYYQLLTGKHPFGYAAAPAARQQELVPASIPGLKRRRWKALVKGLSFERETRHQHAADFLSDLDGSPRLRLALGASVLMLAATASYLAYDQTQQVMVTRPDVAFEALPADTRTSFASYISDGDQLLRFKDMQNALNSYVDAYRLHPRNPQAVERIETLVSQLVGAVVAANDPRAVEALASNIEAIANEDDFLRRAGSLRAALATLRSQ